LLNDPFLTSLLFFFQLALLLTNYQFVRARQLPAQFNETYYMGITNLILFECIFIGVPILVTLGDSFNVFVPVLCFVECFGAMGVLLPMFLPKFAAKADADREKEEAFNAKLNAAQSSLVTMPMQEKEVELGPILPGQVRIISRGNKTTKTRVSGVVSSTHRPGTAGTTAYSAGGS
jgi:hypothetical protein